jgi:hypothetical protein
MGKGAVMSFVCARGVKSATVGRVNLNWPSRVAPALLRAGVASCALAAFASGPAFAGDTCGSGTAGTNGLARGTGSDFRYPFLREAGQDRKLTSIGNWLAAISPPG